MKASCIAVFFALLLSVCVSSQYDVDNTPWDGMKCEDLHYIENEIEDHKKTEDMQSACESNKVWVDKLRRKGDLSVVYSTYMRESRESFKDLFTMHELEFGGSTPDLSGVPTYDPNHAEMNIWDNCDWDHRNRMIAALDTILEEHYHIYAKKSDYVIYAAIDLMNLVYTREFYHDGRTQDAKIWKFSTEQVRQALAAGEEYNTAKLVFEYLREEGVCLEDDYYLQGNACRRYYIGNYYRLLDMTNQGLVDKLESGHPVYVQVALHPDYYQFHSPRAEYEVSKGYERPTYAGVVTGFNFTREGHEHWRMYIRRHELHPDLDSGYNEARWGKYNYVRVATKFQDDEGIPLNPFAGITSMGYTIDVDEEDRDRGMVTNKLLEVKLEDMGSETAPITSDAEFEEAVKASIENYYQDGNTEQHMEEIETLYIHPGFFDIAALNETSTSVNITDILPNVHTLTIDLGENGEWHEDLAYVITDFYDYDLSFVDQTHLRRRRLAGKPGNHGNNNPHGYKKEDPRHPDYKYNGKEYDYSKHHFEGLSDKHKEHHIKVTGMLKNLIFGRYTMPYMGLIVTHSPHLEFIFAKDYSFNNGWLIHIEDCENLKQISFGLHTFSGWLGAVLPKGIRMDLIDLPALNTFVFDYDAAFNIYDVKCTNVANPLGEFTLIEDRAFPNQKNYTYYNNHQVVDDYFRRIFGTTQPENTPTEQPKGDN